MEEFPVKLPKIKNYRFEKNEVGELPKDLIIQIGLGAYRKLVVRYPKFPRCYSREDLLQETIFQALNSKYDPARPKLVSIRYIMTRAYRLSERELQKQMGIVTKMRGPSVLLSDRKKSRIVSREPSPDAGVLYKEGEEAVRRLIRREPNKATRALVRSMVKGERKCEAARRLGVSHNRIDQRVSDFRERAVGRISRSKVLRTYFGEILNE